jgi:hypothetical protein
MIDTGKTCQSFLKSTFGAQRVKTQPPTRKFLAWTDKFHVINTLIQVSVSESHHFDCTKLCFCPTVSRVPVKATRGTLWQNSWRLQYLSSVSNPSSQKFGFEQVKKIPMKKRIMFSVWSVKYFNFFWKVHFYVFFMSSFTVLLIYMHCRD